MPTSRRNSRRIRMRIRDSRARFVRPACAAAQTNLPTRLGARIQISATGTHRPRPIGGPLDLASASRRKWILTSRNVGVRKNPECSSMRGCRLLSSVRRQSRVARTAKADTTKITCRRQDHHRRHSHPHRRLYTARNSASISRQNRQAVKA